MRPYSYLQLGRGKGPLSNMYRAFSAGSNFFRAADCKVADLDALIQTTEVSDYPLASDVASGILVYDAPHLIAESSKSQENRMVAESELYHALSAGPGVVVFRNSFDIQTVDEVSEVFSKIIAMEAASGSSAGLV